MKSKEGELSLYFREPPRRTTSLHLLATNHHKVLCECVCVCVCIYIYHAHAQPTTYPVFLHRQPPKTFPLLSCQICSSRLGRKPSMRWKPLNIQRARPSPSPPCVNTSRQTETGSQRCLLCIDETALSGSWHQRGRARMGLDAMSSITIVNVDHFGMPSTSAFTNVFAAVLMCVWMKWIELNSTVKQMWIHFIQ